MRGEEPPFFWSRRGNEEGGDERPESLSDEVREETFEERQEWRELPGFDALKGEDVDTAMPAKTLAELEAFRSSPSPCFQEIGSGGGGPPL